MRLSTKKLIIKNYTIMKNIAIIGSSIHESQYNEFEQASIQVMKKLEEKYNFLGFFCSKTSEKNTESSDLISSLNKSQITLIKKPLLFGDYFSLINTLFKADILFIKGTSTSLLFPIIRLISPKKTIVSINNSELDFKKNNPLLKFYFLFKEKVAIKYAHINLTYNESQGSKNDSKYGINAKKNEPEEIHVERIESTYKDHKTYPFLKYIYAVNICSVSPENNIEIVLRGFSQIKNKYLVIIGNWNESDYGINLKKQFSSYANIFMLDPISDKRNIDLIRSNAILYIHAENTNMNSILLKEAMCLKLPVFAFNNEDNKLMTDNKASYFNTSDEISSYISHMSIEKIRKNAAAMSEISSRKHKWSFLSEKYETIIFNVLNEIYNRNTKLQPIR